jgi:PAS domain S-box-containing protein
MARGSDADQRPPSLLNALFGASEVAAVVADEQGCVLDFSRGAEELFGYRREETLGRNVGFLMPEEQAAAHARAFERGRMNCPATRRRVHHKIARRADGSLFAIEITLTRVTLARGMGWVTTMREESAELSEIEERGEALLAAQRLELLGELASGVAHDLNNLLTPILASVDLLEGAVQGLEPRSDLRAIAGAAVQGRHLLRQLLYFSRRGHAREVATKAEDVTREALAILRRTRGEGLNLKLSVASELPHARVDAVQLEQVVLNLVGNAIYATRDHGPCVCVQLDAVELDAGRAPGRSAGRFVRLSVQDQGPGVPEEQRERIFEPFFSTKPAGEGTGLGLSVSRGIAQRHGGLLQIEPSERGARFVLYLPAVDAEMADIREDASPLQPLALRRVLAVDDDPVVLRALSRLLRRLDLEVESFTEPADALAYLERREGNVDALLTDHQMPSMTGLELAEGVRRLRPDLPILLVSGLGHSTPHAARFVDAVLPKPFRQHELAQALRDAVRSHAASA